MPPRMGARCERQPSRLEMKKLFLIGIAALSVLCASAAHTREWQGNLPKPVWKLPPYPPVVCVAPDWAVEDCEQRMVPLPVARPRNAPIIPDELGTYWKPREYWPQLTET